MPNAQPNLNWLDRAIHWIAPRSGLRRIRARALSNVMLAYEGARMDRRTAGWLAGSSGPNLENGPALATLRQRSRDLVRNNPYAARALEELSGNAIGTGITAKTIGASKTVVSKVDDAWKRWIEECDADNQHDFYGLERLVARTTFESGGCLIRRRPRFSADGFHVPLQLQVLEPDYIDTTRTQATATGYIIQGIEFDQLGRRQFYWLFPQHPGDTVDALRGGFVSSRVPADQILHVYRKRRPGEVHGVPVFAPVMMALRDLDEYEDAEIVRKKVEACLAAFVTQDEDPDAQGLGPASTDQPSGSRLEAFSPGMIEYLKPGQQITLNQPTSNGQGYREFLRTGQTKIASGLGLTYEQLTGDNSNTNYSSHKAGMLSFRNTIDSFRWLDFIPLFCQPARDWFVDMAFAAGRIPSQVYSTKWSPPAHGTVDPLKDAIAALTDVRMGRKSLQQIVEEGDRKSVV